MSDKDSSKSLINSELIWTLGGLVIVWGFLITQVRHHWGGESYYNFGWFVPPLAAWLLLKNVNGLERSSLKHQAVHLWLGILSVITIIPFHALSEVNPFWRLPLWIQASGISVFTFLILHRAYGWQGVLKGLFPVFFLTTMIPWPYRLELQIVQNLTQVVIGFSLHGLHFLGYPVELAGNSLVLGDMRIGVNEACSGIRSLQALFMVTLFLGSLFGQTIKRRVFTLIVLPVIVIVVNTGRAIFLSLQVIENGNEAYDRWHDPIGYITFGISMILIYATIELLNKGLSANARDQKLDLKQLLETWVRPKFASKFVWMFSMVPLCLFLAVEGWFRYKEMLAPPSRDWTFNLPSESDPDYRYLEFHRQVVALLGYSYGYRFQHRINSRIGAEVSFYGYDEDNKLGSVSSYGHSPTICMGATGAELVEQFPDLFFQSGSLAIPVNHFLFRIPSDDYMLHIFWIVFENRNMDIPRENLQSLDYKTQWIQLLNGRRDFSRKVVHLSFFGVKDARTARAEAEKLLNEWIIPLED